MKTSEARVASAAAPVKGSSRSPLEEIEFAIDALQVHRDAYPYNQVLKSVSTLALEALERAKRGLQRPAHPENVKVYLQQLIRDEIQKDPPIGHLDAGIRVAKIRAWEQALNVFWGKEVDPAEAPESARGEADLEDQRR